MMAHGAQATALLLTPAPRWIAEHTHASSSGMRVGLSVRIPRAP